MLNIIRRPGLRSTLKAVIVTVMLLLMLIPLSMIRSQVYEREVRADEAARDIIGGAGGSLEMVGPLLVLPYEVEVSEELDGKLRRYTRRGEVSLLPEYVSVNGVLDVEYRFRGIYRVPVYTVHLEADGGFIIPGPEVFPDAAVPLTNEYRLVVGIADMRGIREVTPLLWNGIPVEFGPDAGHPSLGMGIGAGLPEFPAAGSAVDFSWSMEVSGGGSVSVAPLGRDSKLQLSGNWASPSFQGAMLPDERELDDEGFTACWRIPEVSRPIRPFWDNGAAVDLSAHALRVELLEPVGAYTRTERSVKYGALFLLIPFVVFFLFETLGGLRVHPVQYLLAGAADVLFYLLLLALSEHIGFNIAYILAAAAVMLLISFYARSITGGRSKALAMPVVLTGAYFWLWVTLQSEDYALLIGSAGLFLIVALVMILTRKVDWYGAENVESTEVSDPMNSGSEGDEGEPGELDMLLPEGDSDEGDGE